MYDDVKQIEICICKWSPFFNKTVTDRIEETTRFSGKWQTPCFNYSPGVCWLLCRLISCKRPSLGQSWYFSYITLFCRQNTIKANQNADDFKIIADLAACHRYLNGAWLKELHIQLKHNWKSCEPIITNFVSSKIWKFTPKVYQSFQNDVNDALGPSGICTGTTNNNMGMMLLVCSLSTTSQCCPSSHLELQPRQPSCEWPTFSSILYLV